MGRFTRQALGRQYALGLPLEIALGILYGFKAYNRSLPKVAV
jgi:hypothetical protein